MGIFDIFKKEDRTETLLRYCDEVRDDLWGNVVLYLVSKNEQPKSDSLQARYLYFITTVLTGSILESKFRENHNVSENVNHIQDFFNYTLLRTETFYENLIKTNRIQLRTSAFHNKDLFDLHLYTKYCDYRNDIGGRIKENRAYKLNSYEESVPFEFFRDLIYHKVDEHTGKVLFLEIPVDWVDNEFIDLDCSVVKIYKDIIIEL